MRQLVYLLSGLLIFVTSSFKTDTDSLWDVADTLRPDLLVQHGVNSDIPRKQEKRKIESVDGHGEEDSRAIKIVKKYSITETYFVPMALVANFLISAMALGARFLKVTPYNLLLM
jgi:hypothetical protein